MLFDLLGQLVINIFFSGAEAAAKAARRKDRHEKHEAGKPAESLVRFVTGQYRSWAKSHGLIWDDEARAWCGRLASCAVRVRPGLAGSSPGFVFVDVEIAHDHPEAALVTPSSPRAEPLIGAMVEVFEDEELDGKLRSIALVSNGLTLRLESLTLPEIVERAIGSAVTRVPSQANPYR